LAFAVPISLVILGLFTYWFAFADRYFIFLYHHDMGSVVPDTSPFSAVTSSRYWMAGLVASGAIMVLYAAVNWLVGRLQAHYYSPPWWWVWVLCAIALLVGIPAVTMIANQPTLPLKNAAQTTLATLAGLALALLPGRMAAGQPTDLLWLAADGWGLALIMVTVTGLQNLPRWLAQGGTGWVWATIVILLAAMVWMLAITGLRIWQRLPVPGAVTLFIAGLCVAYGLLPLMHNLYVWTVDGYYYISNSNNFFSDYLTCQLAAWLAAGVLAAAVTWLRRHAAGRRATALL
jgi:hypothetical protein